MAKNFMILACFGLILIDIVTAYAHFTNGLWVPFGMSVTAIVLLSIYIAARLSFD